MTDIDRDRLDGRRALVTGGTKGAGKAVVALLRELGADVYVSARIMPDGEPHPVRRRRRAVSPPPQRSTGSPSSTSTSWERCAWTARCSRR